MCSLPPLPPNPPPPGIGARTFMEFCKFIGPMLFCVIPVVCCVKLGCHTYKEFRQDLVQILLIRSTHIPAWSACHRGSRALSWAWNKPPFPKKSPGNMQSAWRPARWKHDAIRPLFQVCSHLSDVSACLCHDFSTSATPSYGKGMKDNGPVCSFRVCHEGFQTKGNRGSHIPHSSSAHPSRKRKWLGPHHSERVSTCPCDDDLKHTQRDTFLSCFQ